MFVMKSILSFDGFPRDIRRSTVVARRSLSCVQKRGIKLTKMKENDEVSTM